MPDLVDPPSNIVVPLRRLTIADVMDVSGDKSIVKLRILEAADVFPTASDAFAVILCSPSASTGDVNVQLVPVTVARPSDVAPSNNSTIVPDSVVPSIVGVLSIVAPDAVVIIGADGGIVSMVTVILAEFGDVFPAASVALASIV